MWILGSHLKGPNQFVLLGLIDGDAHGALVAVKSKLLFFTIKY